MAASRNSARALLVGLTASTLLAGAAAATPVTVPFELVRNQVVLEVWIGESGPYSMLLDTGVTPSGLHVAVARENGLLTSDEPVGFAGGVGSNRIPLYAASLRGLRIGSLGPEPFDAVAMDNSHLSERLGRAYVEILPDERDGAGLARRDPRPALGVGRGGRSHFFPGKLFLGGRLHSAKR